MKLSKIGEVVKDWVKSGYWFGYGFSNMVAEKTEVSPKAARWGGAAFDTVAGAGLSYMSVASGINNLVIGATALAAIGSAPITAVSTAAVSTVFVAVSFMTGGIGLGFLRSGLEKTGLASPSNMVKGAQNLVFKSVEAVKSTFKPGRRPSQDFKNAGIDKSAQPTITKQPGPTPHDPAPKMGG